MNQSNELQSSSCDRIILQSPKLTKYNFIIMVCVSTGLMATGDKIDAMIIMTTPPEISPMDEGSQLFS